MRSQACFMKFPSCRAMDGRQKNKLENGDREYRGREARILRTVRLENQRRFFGRKAQQGILGQSWRTGAVESKQ